MTTNSPFTSPATPLRVAVFGASGGVGRLATEQALERAHEVVAYVRSPAKLGLTHERLRVVAGELTDREAIEEAVRGANAVISALGPSLDRKATGMPLVDGTRNIVEAMRATGVRRYVGMATPSLRDPRDKRSLIGTIVPVMGRVLLPRAYRELLAMSQIVIDSDLDWTIARFSQPTDKPATGAVRAGFLGTDKVGMAITRADIATFLLDQVTDARFVRAAPAISN
ncbi:MAG: SDR family oxidoreductase [Actinomycetota bacterium]|nr:SDR family oxidoreductase [Actinomycetota bacterium]